MVKQAVFLQPMKEHIGADIHPAARGGPHTGVVGYGLKEAVACGEPTLEQTPGRNCILWIRAHAGVGFLARTATRRGPMLEQSVPE